jgi:hypothetical protein
LLKTIDGYRHCGHSFRRLFAWQVLVEKKSACLLNYQLLAPKGKPLKLKLFSSRLSTKYPLENLVIPYFANYEAIFK